jgi:tRNA pseudouridine55 synthase
VTGGVLVVDKPAGPTSFEVVRRVKRLLRAEKVGHAGTLDPAATGVLVVCLEDAVKLQQFLADADKVYEATFAFGVATDTEDAEGRPVATGDPSAVTEAAVRSVLPRFTGEIAQVPPMYSAVRVGGRRLHEAARAGEEVERAPRSVRVHALELLSFHAAETAPAPGGAAPPSAPLSLARVRVRCGKGTYVRTLAADVGTELGVPAHLAALRRVEASGYRVADAIALDEAERLVEREGREALRARVRPPDEALAFLPAAAISLPEARELAHGRALRRDLPAAPLVRAVGPGGRLVAVCQADGARLRPLRVLVTPGEVG